MLGHATRRQDGIIHKMVVNGRRCIYIIAYQRNEDLSECSAAQATLITIVSGGEVPLIVCGPGNEAHY
jgi:hypothetical protein